MLQFDPTISLGTILAAVSIVSGTWVAAWKLYNALIAQISDLRSDLVRHADAIARHETEVTKLEDALQLVVADVQRLIGRLERRR